MSKYIGSTDYNHDTPECIGILLSNIGTPDEPSKAALHKYLAEFLSDRRVIEIPGVIWWFILHGIILRLRPKRSAKAYQKIWTSDGSPLMVIARKQAATIQEKLNENFPNKFQVKLTMRYGNPSIRSGLEELARKNSQRILIFPLYPQYSATTTASTFDAVTKVMRTWRWIPEIRMINHYHDDAGYINALKESISEHWAVNGLAEKLLFSFHGIPKSYFDAGDPYYCQCHKTARLVVENLNLNDNQWFLSFQSRFGPGEWLKPYTDMTLKQWGAEGIKSVDVISPGFSAVCLETLEEINMRNRDFFIQAGGEKFSYIPALNDRPSHIDALLDIILRNCQNWD